MSTLLTFIRGLVKSKKSAEKSIFTWFRVKEVENAENKAECPLNNL
jgi:hypothetical protein